ncbi:tRNA (adenosine(37)-N6)-threonylcarbamoyltransferase complex ATPase subunit type 1 TsaE [Fulvivirgaceae bacterium LMO-SS25]
MKIICKDLAELENIALKIINHIGSKGIWLVEGQMGAGKTTLIKALCKKLGVRDTVNSPTFSIVNEYENGAGEPIYHFDFYRIKNIEEAKELGFDEYLYSGNLCLIEWSSLVMELIDTPYWRIDILVNDDDSRIITLSQND